MASLKALKLRIGSVKSTQKITKAMKMVAAAKLRRAQEAAEAGRPYAERLEKVMASLASKVSVNENSPKLLAGTGNDQTHLLVVATSERGLAGAFNTNIVRAARKRAEELKAQGKTVRFYLAGKKGRVLRRFYPDAILYDADQSAIKTPGFDDARTIADDLVRRYEAGEFHVAHLFYGKFVSALVQEPTEQQDAGRIPFTSVSDVGAMRRGRVSLPERTRSPVWALTRRLLLALARFGDTPCVLLAQDRRGQTETSPLGPAALREARRGMLLAEELRLPLLTVIDTPGAALSVEAEEGGLAGEIAAGLAAAG